MHFLTMARQYPLKTIIGQTLHRLSLLFPRIPAIMLGGSELLPVSVPIQMIAGKETTIIEKKYAVPLGVSWCRDGEKSGTQLPRTIAIEHNLSTGLRRQLFT